MDQNHQTYDYDTFLHIFHICAEAFYIIYFHICHTCALNVQICLYPQIHFHDHNVIACPESIDEIDWIDEID